MKRILFLMCLLISGITSQGQTVTKFYTNEDVEVSREDSHYYKVGKQNETGVFYDTVITYYTVSDKIRSIQLLDDSGFESGWQKFFYENGNTHYEYFVLMYKRAGAYRAWYRDGKPHFKEVYSDSIVKIIDYWNESGEQIVKDGNGYCDCILSTDEDNPLRLSGKVVEGLKDSVWTGSSQDKTFSFTEEYNLGRLIKGESYDLMGMYSYSVLEESANPNGGFEKFYQYVGSIMRYPKVARRAGIEGKVFVEFVVNKNGSLSDFKVLRGIGGGCDEEAVRAIKSSPDWKPGLQRGRPVRQRMVLPLIFKLG